MELSSASSNDILVDAISVISLNIILELLSDLLFCACRWYCNLIHSQKMGCGRFSAKYENRRQHKRLAFSFMIIKVLNVKGKTYWFFLSSGVSCIFQTLYFVTSCKLFVISQKILNCFKQLVYHPKILFFSLLAFTFYVLSHGYNQNCQGQHKKTRWLWAEMNFSVWNGPSFNRSSPTVSGIWERWRTSLMPPWFLRIIYNLWKKSSGWLIWITIAGGGLHGRNPGVWRWRGWCTQISSVCLQPILSEGEV